VPNLASQSRTAFASMASKIGASSPDELEIICSTSEVAFCCSRASASSRVRALTCSCTSARVELAGRVAVGALLRLGFVVLPCCVFAGLRLIVRCRVTEASHGLTTIHYHIMRSVVQHSKIDRGSSAQGQQPANVPTRAATLSAGMVRKRTRIQLSDASRVAAG
jgi:hypothetical protein